MNRTWVDLTIEITINLANGYSDINIWDIPIWFFLSLIHQFRIYIQKNFNFILLKNYRTDCAHHFKIPILSSLTFTEQHLQSHPSEFYVLLKNCSSIKVTIMICKKLNLYKVAATVKFLNRNIFADFYIVYKLVKLHIQIVRFYRFLSHFCPFTLWKEKIVLYLPLHIPWG